MKRRAVSIITLVAVMSAVSPAYADNDNPFRKFTRGLTNIVTGWLEVPVQISRVTESEGSISGSTVGFVKGLLFGIGRTGVGVLEAVTFLLPNHVSGDGANEQAYGPIVTPEFVVFRSSDIE